MGTGSGLVSMKDGEWRRHGLDTPWEGAMVRFFIEGGPGELFATSFPGAICRLEGGELEPLPPPVPERPKGGYHGVSDAEGKLWVFRKDYFGHWAGGRWVAGGAEAVNALTNGFLAAAPARDGGAWALTDESLIRLRGGEVASQIPLSRSVCNIWSLYEDEDGELWAASYSDGVFLISRDGTVAQFREEEGGLSVNSLRFVTRGTEGNLWIGTSGGGLMRLRPRLFQVFGAESHLGSPVIKSVAEEREGVMLLATFGGGVARLDLGGGEPVVTKPWESPPHAQALLRDSRGWIWMGGHGYFLSVRKNGVNESLKIDGATPENVRALFEDSRGNVWIGAGSSVMRHDDGGLGRVLSAAGEKLGNARGFAEHPKDGSIWVVSERGLHQLRDEAFEEVRGGEGEAMRGALCLHFDDSGALWVGTRHRGLHCLRDGKWGSVDVEQGLPTPLVGSIIEDGHGAVWLGTDRGVAQVTKESLAEVSTGLLSRIDAQFFGTADGLLSGETAWGFQPSSVRDSQGRLWFPTIRGVGVMDPRRTGMSAASAATTLIAAGYVDRLGARRNLLASADKGRQAVAAGGSGLHFRFTSPNFSAPERVSFEHRLYLNGARAHQGDGHERDLRFALLPPGDYRLEIRARNHRGVVHPEPAVFQFSVLPFYWQTAWFRAGVVCVAILIAGALVWQVRSYEVRLTRAELERKRALWESEELRRLAMEVARLEMWEWRLDTGELRSAPGLRTLFAGDDSGRSFDRMEDCLKFVHPDDQAEVEASVSMGAESEGRVHMEFRVIWEDGSTHWLEGRGEALNDAQGRPERVVGMMVDATARKRAEEERRWLEATFQEKERKDSLGAMASGIAHDFNNLLTAIMCNIDLVQSRLERDVEGKGALHEAEEAAERAADLCRQMVAYAGKGQFVSAKIDLAETIHSLDGELRKVVGKRVALRLRLTDEPLGFMADPAQVGQVIMNLVENAAEAIGEGKEGVVTVETEAVELDEAFVSGSQFALKPPVGRCLMLRVRDTGEGLGKAELGRIFDPFYSSKFLGRGLGLAAVTGIVRALGGGLAASAPSEGGMIFEIWFPALEDSDAAQPCAGERDGRFRVIVIDDEDAVLETACNCLNSAGFEAMAARSGAEGVSLLQAHQAETACILLDLIMPGIDGVETLGLLRRVDKQVPVFLMSGLSEEGALERFTNGDLTGFVKKPFWARQLIDQVREVVDAGRSVESTD